MQRPLKYVQALSLDIAVGGTVGAVFVATYLNVEVPFIVLLELGFCIWLIYTFDHLMDARLVLTSENMSFRHRFHRRYSTEIWGFWSLVLVIALSLLFKIPEKTIFYGLLVSLLVLTYFLSLKLLEGKKIYHKEISAAVVYSIGVFVGPISIYSMSPTWDVWLLFFEFVAVALANLLIFSLYEQKSDVDNGFHSLATAVGYTQTRRILLSLLGVFFLAALAVIVVQSSNVKVVFAQGIILAMLLFLGLLILWKKHFLDDQRFRAMGDGVFLLPALYVLFH